MTENNKYSRGKIYSIRSYQFDKFYIGSTIIPLSKRLSGHRMKYKYWLNQEYHYVSSFELMEYEDVYIELIENFPCNSVEELTARERQLIRENKDNVVNIHLLKTKEEIKQKCIKHHRIHANEKIKCTFEDCNIQFSRANKSIHMKKYHC